MHLSFWILHTNAGCSISNYDTPYSGTLMTSNCDVYALGQVTNAGCLIKSPSFQTFGNGFNAIGGGVYATEWTSTAISIYFFPRNAIPADITSGNPDPSGWGEPQAIFSGDCDIDSHLVDQRIVFDTTFCGDWAGSVWNTDAVCSPLASTCEAYVQNNPSAFTNAYWSVNSLRVYSASGSAPTASRSSISSTTSVSSTTSLSSTTTSLTAITTSSYTTPTSYTPSLTATSTSSYTAPASYTTSLSSSTSSYTTSLSTTISPSYLTPLTFTTSYTYTSSWPDASAAEWFTDSNTWLLQQSAWSTSQQTLWSTTWGRPWPAPTDSAPDTAHYTTYDNAWAQGPEEWQSSWGNWRKARRF